MNERQEKQINDIFKCKEPGVRVYSQKFEYNSNSITHQNIVEVERSTTKTDQLSIRNHFATAGQDRVFRWTEIRLDDRIIKITDSFTSFPPPPSSINSNLTSITSEPVKPVKERKNILDKRFKVFASEGQNQYRIRDTKNVVKNIFRLFQTWTEDNTPSQLQLNSSLTSLYSSNGKYNNNLVIQLSREPILREAFLAFCQSQAEQAIGRSKIHDKQSHLQALRKYQRICYDQQLTQEIEQDKLRNNQVDHNIVQDPPKMEPEQEEAVAK